MKIFLVTLISFFSIASYSQTVNDANQKIIEVFGQEKFIALSNSNPGYIKYLSSYSTFEFELKKYDSSFKNAVDLSSIPLFEKGASISNEEFIKIVQNEGYNILHFAFLPGVKEKVFHLMNTEYYFVVPSQKRFL